MRFDTEKRVMDSHPGRPGLWDLQKKLENDRVFIAQRLSNIRKVIAVLSGKGGVGKTFVATNLAFFLSDKGYHVGLVDGDIDCPNIPAVLGLSSDPGDPNQGFPVEFEGVSIVSMGLLNGPLEADQPRIWRGPLIGKALTDLLTGPDWNPLDFLVIDMPPGTSDAALILMQLVRLDGIILVGTSSPAAVLDIKKTFGMARQMNKPVLGIVENMAGPVFGSGRLEQWAKEMHVPFLATIPLLEKLDSRKQPVVRSDLKLSSIFDQIAKKALFD